ncbi:HlyD family efflux transporter periplasmic adaptor subunit [Aerophototrophica crusticola]|uniref:HlyD family efflux transporter periplasmic adaptor subunit n=1 Tax=Aerophototrophica crusticola TaxID=1709002 RepID=A0A858R8U7_9PROT|nr:HlyD family efflux transporter periplasmic adaptor subunit [Rhodospirillaceae bacterium B3]
MRPEIIRALPLAALALLAACGDEGPTRWQGYAEGEYLRMGAPEAGWVESLSVARGQRVEAGAPLFTLESSRQQAALAQARAELARAEANLADLRLGRRPEEIAQVEARLHQHEAMLRLAQLELRRQEQLARQDVAAKARLDQARAEFESTRAQVAATEAELATARLPARADQIAAAEGAVAAAKAALAQAQWSLDQRRVVAPVAALVDDTLRRPGEWVPANGAVVTLLPPRQVKLVLFVPEGARSSLAPGKQLSVGCDGCPPDMTARVSFVAAEAEYTPPVLYSVENRAKLVYRVEALPEGRPFALLPGQPVDVAPLEAASAGAGT